tara:strand:+ start:206 stop:613 length:408 start_codon:yes stop_codon:yes gene_type:complete
MKIDIAINELTAKELIPDPQTVTSICHKLNIEFAGFYSEFHLNTMPKIFFISKDKIQVAGRGWQEHFQINYLAQGICLTANSEMAKESGEHFLEFKPENEAIQGLYQFIGRLPVLQFITALGKWEQTWLPKFDLT